METMDDFKEELEKPFKTDEQLAWDELAQMMADKTTINVTIGGVVNAGVIAYVNDIRGFIPASQISTEYVEDLNAWLNKTLDVKIITVDEEKNRLVLSGRAVAQDLKRAQKLEQIKTVTVGSILEGTVDKITSYGAFINLENGLSGLVHISQISQKRIATPNEVLKVGDDVKVKVIANKDGKLSLSIKALQEPEEDTADYGRGVEYKDEGEAITGLGALLQNIKLD